MQQVLLNALITASSYTLVAMGFAIVFRIQRFVNFAHGAVFTTGAYVTFYFVRRLGWPLPLSVLMSLIVCGVLGAVIDAVVYRDLRKRKSSPTVILLSSLGIYIMLQNCISVGFGDEPQRIRSEVVVPGMAFLNALITWPQLTNLLVTIAFVALGAVLTQSSSYGMQMRAIACDRELAKSSGVRTEMLMIASMVFASALAGLAGSLVALDLDVRPAMGEGLLMMGIVVVLLSGRAGVIGIAVSALLLASIQHLSRWFLGSGWEDALTFGLVVGCLALKRRGVMSMLTSERAV